MIGLSDRLVGVDPVNDVGDVLWVIVDDIHWEAIFKKISSSGIEHSSERVQLLEIPRLETFKSRHSETFLLRISDGDSH